MKTLRFLSYKCDNETAFMKAVVQELLCAFAYSIIGYVYHRCLDLGPFYWTFFNMSYIIWTYWKYYSGSFRSGSIRSDIVINYIKDNTITGIFNFLAWYLFPYLVHYPLWWFWWSLFHSIYFYFMEDLFYIMLHPHSQFFAVAVNLIVRVLTMEDHLWDLLKLGLHVNTKVETKEDIQEIKTETEKTTIPLEKKREIQEELSQSLVEECQKLKQREESFEKWRSSNAKKNCKPCVR